MNSWKCEEGKEEGTFCGEEHLLKKKSKCKGPVVRETDNLKEAKESLCSWAVVREGEGRDEVSWDLQNQETHFMALVFFLQDQWGDIEEWF